MGERFVLLERQVVLTHMLTPGMGKSAGVGRVVGVPMGERIVLLKRPGWPTRPRPHARADPASAS